MGDPTILAVDVSCLAYRSFYTTGGLSYGVEGTGALFGLLRTVCDLCDLFGTDEVAWCFDGGCSARRNLFADYKRNRDKKDSPLEREMAKAKEEVRRQVDRLRDVHLPKSGFRNVFCQHGLEADDMIAEVVDAANGKAVVIASSDSDLLQLIGPRVLVWSPAAKRVIDEKSFRQQYGIGPSMWPAVKAIAGCHSDGVPGIAGVGEKTAVKFLSGCLKPTSKAYKAIVEGSQTIERNRLLVTLPHPDAKPVTIEDESADWYGLFARLGMASLVDRRVRRGFDVEAKRCGRRA